MGSGFLHGVKRERLTAEEVAHAMGLLPVTGAGHRLSVTSGRGGTTIGFTDGPLQLVDFRLAVVVNKGPNKEADYKDERYWTIAALPAAGAKADAIRARPNAANYPGDWWVPATNLSEWMPVGGAHDLAVDGTRLVIVFRLVDAADNERFVFDAAAPLAVRWGKAAADWADGAGNASYVNVHPCDDKDGTSPDATTTVKVWLPRAGKRDPNVRADDVVAYLPDPAAAGSGNGVCVSDYLDDALGTVKAWNGAAADIPPGWRLCDGGGTSPDLTGRFVVGYSGAGDYASVGQTGGSATQPDHALFVTTDSVCPGTGLTPKVFISSITPTTLTHGDNRPPYYVLCYIVRVH